MFFNAATASKSTINEEGDTSKREEQTINEDRDTSKREEQTTNEDRDTSEKAEQTTSNSEGKVTDLSDIFTTFFPTYLAILFLNVF